MLLRTTSLLRAFPACSFFCRRAEIVFCLVKGITPIERGVGQPNETLSDLLAD